MAATNLAYLVQPPSVGTAGVVLSPSIQVGVENSLGVVQTGTNPVVTLSIGAGPGGAYETGTISAVCTSGTAVFSGTVLPVAGTYTLIASVLGKNTLSLTAVTSSSFSVNAGSPYGLNFQVQPTTALAGVNVSPAVLVSVQDIYNNTCTQDGTSTLTLTIATGPTSTLYGTSTKVVTSGVTTFNALSINTVGNYILHATDPTDTLQFATSNSFNIVSGTATQIIFTTQPTDTISGESIKPYMTVQVEDAFGNVVASDSSTLTLSLINSPSYVKSGGTQTLVSQNGICTFSGINISTSLYSSAPDATQPTFQFSVTNGTLSGTSTTARCNTCLMAIAPESPVLETMRFFSQVMNSKDGSEQRLAMRVAPRTALVYDIVVSDGLSGREFIENLLLGEQKSYFQVPLWTDGTILNSAAGTGAQTLSLTTTNCQFGTVGSSLILLTPDSSTTELHQNDITGISSSLITIGTGLKFAWPAGTTVYPVRKCIIPKPVTSSRHPSNIVQYSISFDSVEDTINLANNSAPAGYTTLSVGPDSGKLVLDDSNWLSNTIRESSDASIIVRDGDSGKLSAISYQTRARRGSVKTYCCVLNRSKVYSIRTLLHYLQGKQLSFLMPIFADDVIPTSGITSGQSTLQITNVNFAAYAALGVDPRMYIRIYTTSGAVIDNQVSNVSVISNTVEQINVASNWGTNLTLAQISYVTVLEKVRIDADDIGFRHNDFLGTTTVSFPVRALLA